MFRRKEFKPQPRQLRIDGVKTEMTPEPDGAEIAAQALLETMAEASGGDTPKGAGRFTRRNNGKGDGSPRDAAYYRRLADRIRQAHDEARLRAMRFIAFCEQELKKPDLPLTGEGSLAMLEAELYKRIDTVEREQGDLRRRWQHCLAEVIVRQMTSSPAEMAETTESAAPAE